MTILKQTKTLRRACVLCCLWALLSSPAAFAQESSSINGDLEQLESLIADTLLSMEDQRILLADLQKNLDENGKLIETSERIIAEREKSLEDLQFRLNEMSEIYRKQSSLSARFEKSSKFWRTFALIAIPAASLLSGGIVYAVMQ